MTAELWVVMPVYNEQDNVEAVLREWLPVLRRHSASFVLCVLNDGSRDRTLEILRSLEPEMPELKVVDKPNSGHGQTCITGYRLALEAGASWVFQMDSDGQCDPQFFPSLWQARSYAAALYGFRRTRQDGMHRLLISRVMSLVSALAFGVWVKDPNVPYRLMRADALAAVLPRVPAEFHLANVLVALLQQRAHGIHWQPIAFRARNAGDASVKALSFAKRGAELVRQLRAARR
jgi:glycosyltransferase involved in cell wall biosynthesis